MNRRRAGHLALAGLALAALSGCAAVLVPAALAAAPEFIAGAMGQFNYRSEFDEIKPLVRARDWLGLSALARAKLVREPDRGEWWQIAGYGHLQAGELALAREAFARASGLLPEEVGIWNLYAYTLSRMGDAHGAAQVIDRALQTDPTSTLAWVISGDLKAEAGRPREALRAYDRALEIDKRDIFAWLAVGLLAKRQGDRAAQDRAIASLKQLYPPFAEQLATAP